MSQSTEESPRLSLPLPRFRQPISDPPLPTVETDEPSAGPLPTPESPTFDPQGPTSPESDPLPPPVLSPDRRTRTGISSRAGDPKLAGEVLAGLIALACLWAYTVAGRRGLHFRQPTDRQVTDVSEPLGNIAARYLPTDVIGKDLIDVTHAAAGVHRYVMDGPLLTRIDQKIPEDPS